MYFRLLGEITFGQINMEELARKCGISYFSWIRKFEYETFTFGEAVKIKEALHSDLTLEELFEWYPMEVL